MKLPIFKMKVVGECFKRSGLRCQSSFAWNLGLISLSWGFAQSAVPEFVCHKVLGKSWLPCSLSRVKSSTGWWKCTFVCLTVICQDTSERHWIKNRVWSCPGDTNHSCVVTVHYELSAHAQIPFWFCTHWMVAKGMSTSATGHEHGSIYICKGCLQHYC